MTDDNRRTGWRRYAVGGALVASGLLAGAVLAATASANAADSPQSGSGGTPSATQSSSPNGYPDEHPGGQGPSGQSGQGPSGQSGQGPSGQGPGGQAPSGRDETKSVRPDEHLLTGDTASKVRAAALAKYPDATIQRVETDSDGVYEAHLITSSGQRVTVEVNKDFVAIGNEDTGPR